MQTTEARRAFIARLDRTAQQAPRRYRRRLLALALLGLAVIALGVLVSLGASVGLVLVLVAIKPILLLHLAKLIWLPIGAGWMLLRALWVKFERPAGRLLAAGEAPELVREVERLRRPSGAPPLDGIVIDDEMNAAAASVPRVMGLLGSRYYLVLGLPLMQALERGELAAVVAHEFGHFSGHHGRFDGWIYHARISWYRLLDALHQKQSRLLGAFLRFFDWYVPYFEAYSFVLARRQELEADAMAARLAGAAPLASALARMELATQRIASEFWPEVDRSIAVQAEPPEDVQRALAAFLRREDPGAAERLWTALSRAPGLDDTHPTLAQRVGTLGIEPALPPPVREDAASALLGPLLPELQRHFNRQWREQVAGYWSQRHAAATSERDRLAELTGNPAPTPDEQAELALLQWAREKSANTEALLRDAARACPANAGVQLRLGERLLEREEVEGEECLWRAMTLDPELAEEVLQRLGGYYDGRADDAGMDRVNAAWAVERSRQQRAIRARSTANASDRFLPHGLSPEALAEARRALRAHGNIRKAWLVRKDLPPELGTTPHFVLLVTWRGMMFSQQRGMDRLVEGLSLPGSFLAMTLEGHRNVGRRIRKLARDPIYRHGKD